MSVSTGAVHSPVKRDTHHQFCGRFELEGKLNFVTLTFSFHNAGLGEIFQRLPGVCPQQRWTKREGGRARLSLRGHGKLIRGQNTTVEMQLVSVFMELLQAVPTKTTPVWVYHLQRGP